MVSSGIWAPTAAHARAIIGAVALSTVAVAAARPDLLVLATPMIVAAFWGGWRRPEALPMVHHDIAHATLQEGEATTFEVSLSDHSGRVEEVAVAMPPSRWVDVGVHGATRLAGVTGDGSCAEVSFVVRAVRWGRHVIRPPSVTASTCLNAFRWVAKDTTGPSLLVLPSTTAFDASVVATRRPGLVGVRRSPQVGTGTEFHGVRSFQPGDRLRRIHWAETLRSGNLQVSSTHAEQDQKVVLIIDAFEDVGPSTGIDGRASSLDLAVRATAAIAGHYARTGDRITIFPIGATRSPKLRAATGRRHLRRLLETLSSIEPGSPHFDDGRLPRGLTNGSLVLVLSPLLAEGALTRLAILAERGAQVIAIDTLPPDLGEGGGGDPYHEIAWRIELLKREASLQRLRLAGVAVVPWRGPGSLDGVFAGLDRHGLTGRR